MNQQYVEENKGQYCKFVQTANGGYELRPVRVPQHVKDEIAAQKRRREMRHQVMVNRRKAQAIDGRSVIFLAIVMTIFVSVCCLFLALQNQINNRMDTLTSLQRQIETLAEDNDVIEKRLVSAENIKAIEAVATQKLGMRLADVEQVVYYSNDQSDYMLQYSSVADAE